MCMWQAFKAGALQKGYRTYNLKDALHFASQLKGFLSLDVIINSITTTTLKERSLLNYFKYVYTEIF